VATNSPRGRYNVMSKSGAHTRTVQQPSEKFDPTNTTQAMQLQLKYTDPIILPPLPRTPRDALSQQYIAQKDSYIDKARTAKSSSNISRRPCSCHHITRFHSITRKQRPNLCVLVPTSARLLHRLEIRFCFLTRSTIRSTVLPRHSARAHSRAYTSSSGLKVCMVQAGYLSTASYH
jgi:hypothetical protein